MFLFMISAEMLSMLHLKIAGETVYSLYRNGLLLLIEKV